ncbi:MAG: hypothetical protein ACRDG3_04410, partial [Tepidiformaceae bacterium]
PGAVDRLRAYRDTPDEPETRLLAATDPANPYGAALPWPRRDPAEKRPLQRAAGAHVVLVNGEPLLYADRGGRSLVTFPAFDGGHAPAAIAALQPLAANGRPLTIERIDAIAASESPYAGAFHEAGFVTGYRGLTWRSPAPAGTLAYARGG